MKTDQYKILVVFLLTFGLMAIITGNRVFLAGNDAARFAHVESLVEHGNSYIDQSRYNWTVDRVTIGEHDYSNKPPLLGVAGAGVYWILKKTLGLSFQTHEGLLIYLITLILVGVTTSWLVAEFYAALGLYEKIRPLVRNLIVVALASGTIITSFSVTFNNHTVAAMLLFTAFHSALSGRSLRAGIFVGLCACVDILPGLVFAPLLLVLLYDTDRRGLVKYVQGVCAMILLFMAVNLYTLGSVLTPKLVSGATDHSSQFSHSLMSVLLPDKWYYPIQCLFSWHGFFSVSPVLIFGAAGILSAVRSDHEPLRRRWSVALCVGCIVLITGHIFLVGSFGGWSYGFRYLIPIIPIILFFCPIVMRTWRIWFFCLLLVVSVLLAFIGSYNPWPPAYEQEANKDPIASIVTNPVGANSAAWMLEHFPDMGLTEVMLNTFISRDPIERKSYLLYFYFSKGDKEMENKIREDFERSN